MLSIPIEVKDILPSRSYAKQTAVPEFVKNMYQQAQKGRKSAFAYSDSYPLTFLCLTVSQSYTAFSSTCAASFFSNNGRADRRACCGSVKLSFSCVWEKLLEDDESKIEVVPDMTML